MKITAKKLNILFFVLGVAGAGCVSLGTLVGGFPFRFFQPHEGSREERIAHAPAAMVVTAHPLASDAGVEMLKAGGNAIDAAVAASFVISVVRPQSTGVGGGGFMLVHHAAHQRTEAFDFRERAPANATAKLFSSLSGKATVDGPMAIATPGLVSGLSDIHQTSGRLAWKTVLQPAIRIARDGFPVYPQLATALKDRADVLQKFPSSTAIFFRNGRPLELGETLIQNDLAATLTRVAEVGSRDFKDGETARRIIASIQSQGGLLQARDLADYRMIRRQVVTGTFAGHRIVSMPPPSSGGVHAIEILNILRNDVNQIKSAGFASPLHWHLMAEAMRRAFADRALHMGDPDFTNVPVARLIGLEHADAWRKSINNNKATPSVTLDVPSTALLTESDSTTHISVIDAEGNAAATTQTINYTFGSCMVAEGTGIVMNDEMDDFARSSNKPNAYGLTGSVANEIAPFKTPLSSMTPTIVFNGAGKVVLVLGSPGGPRIISATLQTIFNSLALQMSPPDAVHAPRIHHQWAPDKLFVEKKFAPAGTLSALESMGHEIVDVDHIGDVQAIFVSEDSNQTDHSTAQVTGVSDTRSEGRPRGLK
jgi:gamma-glutamyltranspeptidase/glutathione hydrolase